jgi:cathepsin L
VFDDFLKKHNKVYDNEELVGRFELYKKSMDDVLEHNSQNHSWFKVINKFSDWSENEFSVMLGYKDNRVSSDGPTPSGLKSTGEPAADVDWRTVKGALTGVKDQGQCGSCWAFSTTGGIEGAEFIASGNAAISLSEQALVDCSGAFGNQGCNGGLMDNGFKYVEKNGLPKEAAYPYTAKDGSCHSFAAVGISKIYTYKDTTDLETDIVKQPISVAVDARKWSSYGGGIFKCGFFPQLDHGVLLVGSFSDYWVIKNSWGSSWGESGFIRVTKTSYFNCGVAKSASYPSTHNTTTIEA